MSERTKVIVAVGGTGGHVFPGCNLGSHLIENNYNVRLITDKRGLRFLSRFKNLKFSILPASPFIKKNIFTLLLSFFVIIISVLKSIFFLTFNRPSIVIGMGGYASFPVCIAATILKIKFVIYENNLVLGKANKYLLPFAEKIFVSYKDLEGINEKYKNKVLEIGNIIKKEIIDYSKKDTKKLIAKLNILVLGGSQAAKVFANILPNIFLESKKKGLPLKIFQHCLPDQSEKLKSYYEKAQIEFETFNFIDNLERLFPKINLAITRSGSSILAELTNACIPFISVPLPSSADNHQLKNANYYQKKDFSFVIEEKDIQYKLFPLLNEIFTNKSLLSSISKNQSQYSDKNVYINVSEELKKIINEKN